jgi:hypothetical protein
MHAAFFFRDKNGQVVKGVECDVDEWRPAPTVEVESVEAKSMEAEAPKAKPAIEATAVSSALLSHPVPQPLHERRKLGWILSFVAALAAGAMVF